MTTIRLGARNRPNRGAASTSLWKLKNDTRAATHTAIRKGLVTPTPCEKCGQPKAQAHHEDYSEPLRVTWLCLDCHRRRHLTMRAEMAYEADHPHVRFAVPIEVRKRFDELSVQMNCTPDRVLEMLLEGWARLHAIDRERSLERTKSNARARGAAIMRAKATPLATSPAS